MRKNVYIDPKCLATSIIPTAIEEYHKEVSGYLIGSNGNSKKMRIVSAYPMLSDIKMKTWVDVGNKAAVERIDGVMKSMRMKLIGGFHTHPDGPNKPSKSDIEHIHEMLEKYSIPYWLEMIVAVKKKEYDGKHEPGWGIRHFGKKVGVRLKTRHDEGFDITLSGYWISKEGKMEANLWTSKKQNF